MTSVVGIGMIGAGVMLLVWLYGNPFSNAVRIGPPRGTADATPGGSGASGLGPLGMEGAGGGGGGGSSW